VAGAVPGRRGAAGRLSVIIFPIRHHSPAAALQVRRLIAERRPRAVLVEGPADATSLIPHLVDADSAPPVAIYAYRTDDTVQSTFWPFCDYSPEYVAIRAGLDVGAHVAFCDVPAAVTLRMDAQMPDEPAPPWDPTEMQHYVDAVAEAAGFDSFDAFWEAAFEQEVATGSPAEYMALLAEFGERSRLLSHPEPDHQTRMREAHMAMMARALAEQGVDRDDVLLVCGAAHAAPISQRLEGADEPLDLPEAAPVALALVPFSYPRLSEQLGYGAGNRAPWFYQQVWELGGDYSVATRFALIALARRLRERGHSASSAQCIDAAVLAANLASLRTKRAPGVDELIDAAVACFGQGQPVAIEAAARGTLIGERIGRVTAKAGRTPLQAEFYATADRLRLPIVDAVKQILVHLPVPREAEQSIFLHRLEVAGVPYARELEGGLGGGGRAASGTALDQLGRVREKWELQWTPATDAQLVERTAWGSTLVDVCGRLLAERLAQASRIDEGTLVLLQMALCDLPHPFAQALGRCEVLAADTSNFPSLVRAGYHLDGLLTYGSARQLGVGPMQELAGRLAARAVTSLPGAAACGDEDAEAVHAALVSLHDLARRGSPALADASGFWEAVALVAGANGTHPGLRGLALVVLGLEGRFETGELAERLGFWLSDQSDAAANARLIAGVFSLHRGTLVRNRGLVRAVTDFLLELELAQLTPLLPVLRRTLGGLSGAERAYLGETLADVLKISGDSARAVLQLSDVEREIAREADAAVAAILVQWKDRYGIG